MLACATLQNAFMHNGPMTYFRQGLQTVGGGVRPVSHSSADVCANVGCMGTRKVARYAAWKGGAWVSCLRVGAHT
jgi:hypothetical protein